jgi:hypothetical protein
MLLKLLSFYYFLWSEWRIKNTINEEDKIILTTRKQWFEVLTALLCRKQVFWGCGAVWLGYLFQKFRRKPFVMFLSQFSDEGCKFSSKQSEVRTQPHGATTCFLNKRTGLQRVNSSRAVSFQYAKRQPCLITSHAVFILFISLHIKWPRWSGKV